MRLFVEATEFYTIKELSFTSRQMKWVGNNIYLIRNGDWPVTPSDHVEIWRPGHGRPGKTARVRKFGRAARFEKPAQIAAEFDHRLDRCHNGKIDYGAFFLAVYQAGLTYEETARKFRRYHLDADQVERRVRQVLRYISGWPRKKVSFEEYNRHGR